MQLTNNGEWLPAEFRKGLVSVIIPTFNRLHLLEAAIESVISQTYRPIECIVVDDGSAENVEGLVHKLIAVQKDDMQIRYLHQRHAGSQSARNAGTLACSGEFIQYLDSDDVLYRDKIETQVNFLSSHPGCDAVFGSWRDGTPSNSEFVQAYAKEDLIGQFLTERCIANFSFLMKRLLVNAIGPWDVEIKRNQEIDYHLRGLILNAKYCFNELETGLVRSHESARISTLTGTKEIHHFYQKWEKKLIEKEIFSEDLRKKIAGLYIWFFTMDLRHNSATVEILSGAIRLDNTNGFFQSKKLKLMRRLAGTKPAIWLWLWWLIYNHKRQFVKLESRTGNH